MSAASLISRCRAGSRPGCRRSAPGLLIRARAEIVAFNSAIDGRPTATHLTKDAVLDEESDVLWFCERRKLIALSHSPSAISAHFSMRSLLRNDSTAGSSDAG